MLQAAATLEFSSGHPLAKAIVATANVPRPPLLAQFRTIRGKGVSGILDGRELLLGNVALLQENRVDCQPAAAEIERLTHQGATPVLLSEQGQLIGLIALRDSLRPESGAALKRLHQSGYRLIMLTGDHQNTARAIAAEVGIDEVIAGVLPEGKAAAIAQLQQQGRRVTYGG